MVLVTPRFFLITLFLFPLLATVTYSSYQGQLRLMLPFSAPVERWVEEPPNNFITERQARSGRYKGMMGMADRGYI